MPRRPSTPRASPVPTPARQVPSPSEEFGSFVSVPASGHPLAAAHDDEDQPLQRVTTTADQPLPTLGERSSSNSKRVSASLSFFDSFTSSAKQNDEVNRRNVLDELLIHEDDPLYWIGASSSSTATANKNAAERALTGNVDDKQPPLLDLEGLSFEPLPPFPSDLSTTALSPAKTSQPSLAPPIASTPIVEYTPLDIDTHSTPTSAEHSRSHSQQHQAQPPTQPTHNQSRPGQPHRSGSYQTLSSISSKFFSSLLAGQSQSASSSDSAIASTSTSQSHSRASSQHRPLPSSHQSLPVAVPPNSSSHHASPFAPHAHHASTLPISGAPGFQPDNPYSGWDKDGKFYEDLERSSSSLLREDDEESDFNGKKSRSSPALVDRNGRGNGKENKAEHERVDTSKVLMFGAGVKLVGRREMTMKVLDEKLANELRPHLPPLSRLPSSWNLLYSLDQHGVSLSTLYDRCSSSGKPALGSFTSSHNTTSIPGSLLGSFSITGNLLVILDANDRRFGAYLGGRIHGPSSSEYTGSGLEKYYGSGESFLWRDTGAEMREKGKDSGGGVEVFKWTGVNDYVALCEGGFISFGGGDGTYGLYLDSALLDGTSSWCPTFNNPPLCDLPLPPSSTVGSLESSIASLASISSEPPRHGLESAKKRPKSFECVGLEVWGV